MQQTEYTVSTVIPAYNSGRYIGRAIESVLAQTRQPEEIIVVDDGSTDDTEKIVRGYGDKIIYIRQGNAGASAARNRGITAAKYEWLAFLDADDEWVPEKLRLQIEHLKRNPNLKWTTANFYRCLCEKEIKGIDFKPAKIKKLLGGKEYFDDCLNVLGRIVRICMDTVLVEKKTLLDAGMFNSNVRRFNDLDLWFRIAYISPHIGYIAEPLAVYHMAISNISTAAYGKDAYSQLLNRHIKLSEEYGRGETFKKCAAYFLKSWLRAMLFEKRSEDIRFLISEFDRLLPGGYKYLMKVLTAFPKTTAAGCYGASKIIRTFGLRRKITRRPPGAKQDTQ